MDRIAETWPRVTARMAGIFYLLTIITSVVSLFAVGKLVVYGDAAATARNIAAHLQLFRLGYTTNLIATLCYVAVTALFYGLFKPVNRNVSLLAAFVSLIGCTMGAVSCLFYFAPSVLAPNAPALRALNDEQLQALALVFLKVATQANNIGLTFFGAYCVLIGYLILRSTFLPRIVGVLMAIGGLGWLTNSFAASVSPTLAAHLSPYIMLPGVLGETVLTVWLLVAGVNARRWNEHAAAPADSPSWPIAGS